MTIRGTITTRKRRLATFAAIAGLTLFGMVYGFAFPSSALAWDNCPKGWVNDPYPGACRRYVDTNGDDICDLSQSEPVATTTTTSPPATSTTSTTAASGEPPTGDCPLGPCIGCRACISISAESESGVLDTTGATVVTGTALPPAGAGSATTSTTSPASSDSGTAATTASGSAGSSFFTHYLVSPISLGFFLIYAVSFVLYKTKRIRIATHRKIWNVLLLDTFLITGVFGVILAIQLDYALPFRIPVDLLFWHVEAGIAMTLISLFHMGWHFNYYRSLLRNSRSKVRIARQAERAQLAGGRLLAAQAREQRRAEREAMRSGYAAPSVPPVAPTPPRSSPNPRPWLEPEIE